MNHRWSQSHKSTWKIYGEALSPTFPCCATIVLCRTGKHLSKHCLLFAKKNFLPSTLYWARLKEIEWPVASVSQSVLGPHGLPLVLLQTQVRAAPLHINSADTRERVRLSSTLAKSVIVDFAIHLHVWKPFVDKECLSSSHRYCRLRFWAQLNWDLRSQKKQRWQLGCIPVRKPDPLFQ